MLTSILSCGGKKKNNGGTTAAPKFKITFAAEPAADGTVTATVDGKAINSGAEVEKGKKVVFTLAIKDATKHELDKWEGATPKKDNALMAELTVDKVAAVTAKLKAKGTATLSKLTFVSGKIHGAAITEKEITEGTAKKKVLTVDVPADKTKIVKTDVTELKCKKGTDEVTIAATDITTDPADYTIPATGDAKIKIKVAKKEGAYDASEFEVQVSKAVTLEANLTVKFMTGTTEVKGADAPTLAIKQKVGTLEADLVPGPNGEYAQVPKDAVLNFTVTPKTATGSAKSYVVKSWTGATVLPIPADRTKATLTMGTAKVNVVINLEEKPEAAKLKSLKLVDKATGAKIAHTFEAKADGSSLKVDASYTEERVVELDREAVVAAGNTIKADGTPDTTDKLKFVAVSDIAGATVKYYTVDTTKNTETEVTDTTGIGFGTADTLIKVVVRKDGDASNKAKEGVYIFKIKVGAQKAKCSEIGFYKEAAYTNVIYKLTDAELMKAATTGGFEYVFEDDAVVFVKATAADGATATVKFADAAYANTTGITNDKLDTAGKNLIIDVEKTGTPALAKRTYTIKLKKAAAPAKHEVKKVKIGQVEVSANDLLKAKTTEGLTVKVLTAKIGTGEISWQVGTTAPEEEKVTITKKVGTSAPVVVPEAECKTDHKATISTATTDYPAKVVLKVKGEGTNVTTYTFNVVVE